MATIVLGDFPTGLSPQAHTHAHTHRYKSGDITPPPLRNTGVFKKALQQTTSFGENLFTFFKARMCVCV